MIGGAIERKCCYVGHLGNKKCKKQMHSDVLAQALGQYNDIAKIAENCDTRFKF